MLTFNLISNLIFIGLAFLTVAPFIYEKIHLGIIGTVPLAKLKLFMLHCRWVRIMLLRTLSKFEINLAEDMCSEWREKMILAYPQSTILDKPNFHNLVHVFAFARKWGPPILYWARPYEHKHKVFRQFVHEGNHQNDEEWCAARHAVLMSLKWLYSIGNGAPKQSVKLHLKQDARIMFRHHVVQQPMYGIVQSWDDCNISVQPLTFRQHGKFHNCPLFESRVLQPIMSVPRSMYVGHFDVTIDGYVNTFILLNMIKR
jgi:hypothetical protein